MYFPDTGYTKLDLVQYYLAVADGALTGIRGRPMALKRSSMGSPRTVLPEAGTGQHARLDQDGRADVPVRPDRRRDRRGRGGALIWVVNLGCIDLNPHPVRADDLDHPDELRVDLDPVPGIEWPQIRDVAMACRDSLADVGLVGWPDTPARGIHINVRVERRWTYPR